jgi:hypothetical protein
MLVVLLHSLPLLVLLAPLVFGRYLGEEKVALLRERLAPVVPEHAHPGNSPDRPCAPRTLMPRGGRLLGASLAVRPPPALAALS